MRGVDERLFLPPREWRRSPPGDHVVSDDYYDLDRLVPHKSYLAHQLTYTVLGRLDKLHLVAPI